MKIEEFNKLKPGSLVYNVVNTGSCGISKYQYLGVFTDHEDSGLKKHLFMSPYFASTLCILHGREVFSIGIKRIFNKKSEAIKYQNEQRKKLN